MSEKEEVKENIWVAADVPVKHEPRVYNSETEETLTVEQGIALILNKLSKLERLL